MSLTKRSATATWQGDLAKGAGVLTSQSKVLADVPLTFPRRMGEPEGHTSPEELIAAAHAGCYAMSFANALTQAGETYESVGVRATITLDRVDGGLRLTAAHLDADVTSADLDGARCAELASSADARCPVSTALRATVDVTVVATVGRGLA